MKTFKIKPNCFPFTIGFMVSQAATREELERMAIRWKLTTRELLDEAGGLNPAGCGTYARTWMFGAHSLIWLPDLEMTPRSISVLAHEANHAVTEAMSYIGSNCDEVRSYLLGFVVEQALGTIKEV